MMMVTTGDLRELRLIDFVQVHIFLCALVCASRILVWITQGRDDLVAIFAGLAKLGRIPFDRKRVWLSLGVLEAFVGVQKRL